jgi:trans-2-enoyl-CoA reductase
MIIKPKIRGFICTTTTHPVGCQVNVNKQIEYIRKNGKLTDGPARVLVIGASTGYGLASRISAAFGGGASTVSSLKNRGRIPSQAQRAGITLRLLMKQRNVKVFTRKASTATRSPMSAATKLSASSKKIWVRLI